MTVLPITEITPETEFEATADTTFIFTWPFDHIDDVKVSFNNDTVSGFEVTGTEGADGFYDGGTVTFSEAKTGTVVVFRNAAIEQRTLFPQGGQLNARDINREIARIWMALQDVARVGSTGGDDGGDPDITDCCACFQRDFFIRGQPVSGQLLLRHVCRDRVNIGPDLLRCGATAGTAATAEKAIVVKVDDVEVARLTFDADAMTAVGSGEGIVCDPGNVITIAFTSGVDATLADIDVWFVFNCEPLDGE